MTVQVEYRHTTEPQHTWHSNHCSLPLPRRFVAVRYAWYALVVRQPVRPPSFRPPQVVPPVAYGGNAVFQHRFRHASHKAVVVAYGGGRRWWW